MKKKRQSRDSDTKANAAKGQILTISSKCWRLFAVVAIGLYLFPRMDRGWIPHDEGMLGQVADRVLYGELPHLDFDDPYSGGLSIFYAGIFKIFGSSLLTIRVVLFAFAMFFAIAVFEIASRFASQMAAAFTTFLAVAWSLPNYFAGMPSWYNLFFAVFGTWLLIKFVETGKSHWVFLAGTLGGLSILVKVSGLFFVAATLLFLVFYEQSTDNDNRDSEVPMVWGRINRLYSAFATVSLAAFLVALGNLIRTRLSIMNVLHFWLPCASLSVYVVVNEWRQTPRDFRRRFINLTTMVGTFCFGCLIPISPFILVYGWNKGVGELIHGVFVAPQLRIESADLSLPPFPTLIASIPIAVLLALPIFVTKRWDTRVPRWLLAASCIIGAFLGGFDIWYRCVWFSVRPCIPLVALLGCLMFARANYAPVSHAKEQKAFLLLVMSSAISLIQFPFSHGIYFCYAAPLVILAILAMVSLQPNPPWRIYGFAFAFYMLFAILWMNTSIAAGIGVKFLPFLSLNRSENSRLGLRVDSLADRMCASVIREIRLHSSDDEYIFATADCPEIYFLSGRRNPTRTFFDFFDDDYRNKVQRANRIMATLEQKDIRVVVFYWRPHFSDQPTQELYDSVKAKFPNSKHFLVEVPTSSTRRPHFSVLWR